MPNSMRVIHRGGVVAPIEEYPPGLGDFTAAAVQALSSESMDRLRKAASDVNDIISGASNMTLEANRSFAELAQRQKAVTDRFGPLAYPGAMGAFIPNAPAIIAMVPLVSASAELKLIGRRIAALDVLFVYLGGTFASIGQQMLNAGLSTEGGNLKQVAALMDSWRNGLRFDPPHGNGFYVRNPEYKEEASRIAKLVSAATSAKGLSFPGDADKAEWWNAIMSVLGPEIGPEISQALQKAKDAGMGSHSPYGTGMGEPVSITLAVIAILKIALICAAIVAALYLLDSAIKGLFGAGNSAMEAAGEFERRKTLRQQMVADGKITQTQANAENKVDSEEVAKEQAEAIARARQVSPGIKLVEALIPVAIAVGGVIVVSKVL